MNFTTRLFLFWQYTLPQHWLSRVFGRIADCKIAWVKNALIRWFIKRYNVNLDEAKSSNLKDYPNFNAFFTRELKPNARPMATGKNAIACPVDGSISQCGKIQKGKIIQAKNHDYSAQELLTDCVNYRAFDAGNFITLYLSPKDYHRIHMPFDGVLTDMVYVPGKLFSVNPTSAEYIPSVFARNERVVCMFDTEFGPMAVVMVGAFFVASIKTTWAGIIAPSYLNDIYHWRYDKQKRKSFKKGEEIGQFQFGSTVIVLTPRDAPSWDKKLHAEQTMRLGITLT